MKKSVLLPYDKYIALKQHATLDSTDLMTEPDKKLSDKQSIEHKTEPQVNQASDKQMSSDDKLLLLLPKVVRSKAERLLCYISQQGKIYWNTNGEVCIEGETIKGSHICDILHYATTNKRQQPIGIQTVLAKLQNVPQSLITNPQISGKGAIPPGIPQKERYLNQNWKTKWQAL